MLISVIVPVYNAEKYLRECLDSIVNQTYKNIEIILVDDGSTDGSGAICDEYADKDVRIKVYHIPNGGASNARNLGIDNADGEYVMFVDADDVIMPYIVKRGVKLAIDNNADIVYGLVQRFKDKIKIPDVYSVKSMVICGEKIKNLATHMFDLHDLDFKNEIGYISRGPCARMLKKQLCSSLKFNPQLVLGEDEIWNLELLREKPRCIVDFNLWYGYRFVENSASHQYRSTAKYDYSNKMIAYNRFTKEFSAEQYCFNEGWSSLMEVCDNYYLRIEYQHSLKYASKDLKKYLQNSPWNEIFCLKWACKSGIKGIVKWMIIKLNLILEFKVIKNKFLNCNKKLHTF